MAADTGQKLIKVTLTNDRLKAYLMALTDVESFPAEEIYGELERLSVKFGIMEDVVESFAAHPFRDPVVVAEGIPPQPGKDEYLEVMFEEKRADLARSESDVVNYRESSTLVSVKAGDLLAVRHPSEPGKEGKAVTGEVIPAPKTRSLTLKAGKGVALEKEGKKAYAGVNGRPWVTEAGFTRIITCEPVYTHNSDVDIKTGNIRFKGNVKIIGNVHEAMEVQADGDVEVQGWVTRAVIKSGGSLTIQGNVVSSKLQAGVNSPGAKKLFFMLSDITRGMHGLLEALEQLKQKVDIKSVDFSRIVFSLMDSKFKDLRGMLKNTITYAASNPEGLPDELTEALSGISYLLSMKPLSEERLEDIIKSVENSQGILSSREKNKSGIILKSALTSIIQSSGNVVVTGQGCVSTDIIAGGNVVIKGSFKAAELLAEGNVEIAELGSGLGMPPVVRVSERCCIKAGMAHEGSVLMVGKRKTTLTANRSELKVRLNRDEQIEFF